MSVQASVTKHDVSTSLIKSCVQSSVSSIVHRNPLLGVYYSDAHLLEVHLVWMQWIRIECASIAHSHASVNTL